MVIEPSLNLIRMVEWNFCQAIGWQKNGIDKMRLGGSSSPEKFIKYARV